MVFKISVFLRFSIGTKRIFHGDSFSGASEPLNSEIMLKISTHFNEGQRHHVTLMTAFLSAIYGMFRISDLLSIHTSHIEFVGSPVSDIKIFIPKSKVDQTYHGFIFI